jgi:tetratricopeptide (TPR) repeat protein
MQGANPKINLKGRGARLSRLKLGIRKTFPVEIFSLSSPWAMNSAIQKTSSKYIICLSLALITLAAFAGVGRDSFITLDDRPYIMANPFIQSGLSWAGIKWAFTGFHSGYWMPVTWLSYMLDCQLFGLNSAACHWVNLVFHIANTILLFLLVYNWVARLWPAAFLALLFALHPMHVESVAWAAERKDVLSAFFCMLALLCYAKYVVSNRGKVTSPAGISSLITFHRSLFYWLALLFFTLGLMAKSMLVTLPFVLLLLDYWPLQRFSPSTIKPLLLEKIPFFLLAGLFSCVNALAANVAGAVKPAFQYSLVEKLAHVPVSYVWYLLKFFWPVNLSVFYPLRMDDTILEASLALLFLLVLTALTLAAARKYPFLLVGWFWFVGTLVPVIGFVQAGDQAYANRFTYLPYIGLFIIIAWGIPELLAKVPSRPLILWAGAMFVIAACFWRTAEEVQFWKDGPTLFKRAIALDPKDPLVWMYLGGENSNRGDYDAAIADMSRAVALDQHAYLAWHELGKLFAHQGNFAPAENAYQAALPDTWFKGDRIEIYNDLGDAFASGGQYDQAIAAYQDALALSAGQPYTQAKIGQCFLQKQAPDQAAAAFQAAIDLQPDNAPAQIGLATILQGTGRNSEAVIHYRKALETDTNSVMGLNNLAWILATDSDPALRNGQEAIALADRACRLTQYDQAMLIGTLAAAYAEVGRFDDAVTTAQKARDVALAHGQQDLAGRNSELLKVYQSHHPFHQAK